MTTAYPGTKRLSEGDSANLHTDLNTYLRDPQEFLALAPSARVTDTSIPAAAVANNTWTQVTGLDTERWDADNMWAAGDPDITIQKPGIYLASGYAAFAANSTGRRGLRLKHSDGSIIAETLWDAGSLAQGMVAATIYDFAAADKVSLWVYQDSGGSLNLIGGENYSADLSAMFLAGLGIGERWVDPRTWIDTGDEVDRITAQDLDWEIGGNASFLYHRPAARVHCANGTQTIPTGSGTETGVLCDTARFDSWGMHDTALGYSRMIAPCDGIYLTGMLVSGFHGSLTGARRGQIKKTSSGGTVSVVARDTSPGRTNDGTPKDLGAVHCVGMAKLLKGETLHSTLTHDGGADINLARNDKASPVFWAAMVAGF